MWKLLAKYRLARAGKRRDTITELEFREARTVLFAVFSRYGDSIMAFKGIREFARRYPEKRCTVVTTRHAVPYAEEIIGTRARLVGIDKRRSLVRIARLLWDLSRNPPDVGLNPWSHGGESQALISFARRFELFTDFAKRYEWINHYQRVWQYLQIPLPEPRPFSPLPTTVTRVVISPFSTDFRRSLSAKDIEKLLDWLQRRFPDCETTVAIFRAELPMLPKDSGARLFFFDKSESGSRAFIQLVKSAELFVGVDSGPLHVADILGVRALGLFGPTPPERVLDRDSTVIAVRLPELAGVLCDIRSCRNVICLHQIDYDALTERSCDFRFASPTTFETERCRVNPVTSPARASEQPSV